MSLNAPSASRTPLGMMYDIPPDQVIGLAHGGQAISRHGRRGSKEVQVGLPIDHLLERQSLVDFHRHFARQKRVERSGLLKARFEGIHFCDAAGVIEQIHHESQRNGAPEAYRM